MVPVTSRTREETATALATLAGERPEAMLIHASYLGSSDVPQISAFAISHRIPTFSGATALTRDGLLLSYSPDFAAMYRRAAYYVDRILKGTRPANLPIEQPTQFELVINLKTAKAIGLAIPPSLLVRASQTIE